MHLPTAPPHIPPTSTRSSTQSPPPRPSATPPPSLLLPPTFLHPRLPSHPPPPAAPFHRPSTDFFLPLSHCFPPVAPAHLSLPMSAPRIPPSPHWECSSKAAWVDGVCMWMGDGLRVVRWACPVGVVFVCACDEVCEESLLFARLAFSGIRSFQWVGWRWPRSCLGSRLCHVQ